MVEKGPEKEEEGAVKFNYCNLSTKPLLMTTYSLPPVSLI
jgi:hypothetical protein